ncbi:MAG: amino acid--tRNA ligase-related protein, partial [Patescibacteria group bacterium]
KWALEKYQSDLVTITHFPTKKRAFYTMPDPKEPEFSLSYDLLFRGLEIMSGSQRINDYGELVKAIKERGLNPKNFEMYLMAFKYGMPPEGGFSFGLERMTKNILNLENIVSATGVGAIMFDKEDLYSDVNHDAEKFDKLMKLTWAKGEKLGIKVLETHGVVFMPRQYK